MADKVGNGGSVISFVQEVHEERIQRIEEQIPELTVQVAQCVNDLGHVKKSLDGIDHKMDALHGALAVHAKETDRRIADVSDRVHSLEDVNRACTGRIDAFMGLIKKLVLPTFAAGTGAFAASYGKAFFDWFRG